MRDTKDGIAASSSTHKTMIPIKDNYRNITGFYVCSPTKVTVGNIIVN